MIICILYYIIIIIILQKRQLEIKNLKERPARACIKKKRWRLTEKIIKKRNISLLALKILMKS